MEIHYTVNKNALVLISLLKQYGIKKVIASPGTVNVPFVASIQQDDFFEVYSCVDERSAAYMACGLASESGEPVVITCTGATASRNYLPALTEAYYRKLPVIAVTGTDRIENVGHLMPQSIDRSQIQKDVAVCSVFLNQIRTDEQMWKCVVDANKALINATRRGGAPVHINLEINNGYFFKKNMFPVEELPKTKKISYYDSLDDSPVIPNGKVAIFVGSHVPFTEAETNAIDHFCAKYGSVVFCDHTSNYHGKYRILTGLIGQQENAVSKVVPDMLIHIGQISGDYASMGLAGCAKSVWRVAPDGELHDTFKKLDCLFAVEEQKFFEYYSAQKQNGENNSYLAECQEVYKKLYDKIPQELPFSNIWVAKRLYQELPQNSFIQLGILNSLRSWNLFDSKSIVSESCNTGGFGIDGGVSSFIGASLAKKADYYYCVTGDLAFFYDMNVLGNRHIDNNVRLMVVNNGVGVEFKFYHHQSDFLDVDKYIGAAGHFGNKSHELLKHYSEDLGFEYLSASNKEEFEKVYSRFVSEKKDKPILFEVFTNASDDDKALYMINHLQGATLKQAVKQEIKNIVGPSTVKAIKSIVKR
mgnify:FL=1